MCRGNAPARRPAGLDRFELLAVLNASADVVDHFFERDAHRHFDQAGVLDLAREREHLGALAFFRAHGSVPRSALPDDVGHVRKRLNVINDRGVAPEPLLDREGRLGLRLAALAFDGSDKRCLFAAHERTGAELHFDHEIEAFPQDILAEIPALLRLLDRQMKTFNGKRVLRPDIDVTIRCADRIGADDHALDHRMRISFDDRAVHERARIALVGVTDQVFVGTRAL